MTYAPPLPKPDIDLDGLKRWMQFNIDTFHRSISMQGTLFSADYVQGTSGWKLSPDGTAEFNEDVDIGGANTTNAQLFIHNTLQHINILENDDPNYPDVQFIIDANASLGRLFWRDSTGAPVSTEGIRISQNGQLDFVTGPVLFPDGAAATPSVTFRASGQQDVGFYRSGTDEISVALAGAQEGVFTTDGYRGLIWANDTLDQDVDNFTNTSYADLDALTGAAFSSPLAVTLNTGAAALVIISVSRIRQDTAGTCFVSFRVSGATTIASVDAHIRSSADTPTYSSTYQTVVTLTPGSNSFEMQARVTANAADLSDPSITVIAL